MSHERSLIAVFPIPGVVAMPGHTVSLHVFEPRYREMVKDCASKNRKMGVALPAKLLSEGSQKPQTLEEALHTNQSTFAANEVLGCGSVEIKDSLPDGRYIIEVRIETRVKILETKQMLPYYLAEVEEVCDVAVDAKVRDTMHRVLLGLSEDVLGARQFAEFSKSIPSQVFEENDLGMLSFQVLRWLRLDAYEMQALLEMRNPIQRSEVIVRALTQVFRKMQAESKRSETSKTEVSKGRLNLCKASSEDDPTYH